MLGWEEGPLVSCKGPFQGRASAGSRCGKAEGDVRTDRAELHVLLQHLGHPSAESQYSIFYLT